MYPTGNLFLYKNNHQMYIIYHLNDGLFCLNCLNDFFCIFILEIKYLKKKVSETAIRLCECKNMSTFLFNIDHYK